ncbi:hypothetical protein [Azospirillum palustre]
MSLLTICQKVADAVGLPRPTAIVNASDNNGKRLLVCAREEARQLVRRGDWQELIRQATFLTEDGKSDYPLSEIASDLSRIINGTEWTRGLRRPMNGPLGPQERQAVLAWALQPSFLRQFWVIGSTLTIYPTPAVDTGGVGETIALEYISKAPIASAAGVRQEDWAADSDVGVLDEYLFELGIRWRFLKSVGMEYAPSQGQYEEEVRKALARGGGAPVLSLASRGGDPFADPTGRMGVDWTNITIPAGQL